MHQKLPSVQEFLTFGFLWKKAKWQPPLKKNNKTKSHCALHITNIFNSFYITSRFGPFKQPWLRWGKVARHELCSLNWWTVQKAHETFSLLIDCRKFLWHVSPSTLRRAWPTGDVEQQAVQSLGKSVFLGKHKILSIHCVLLSLLAFLPPKLFIKGSWKNSVSSQM